MEARRIKNERKRAHRVRFFERPPVILPKNMFAAAITRLNGDTIDPKSDFRNNKFDSKVY
jgi:hypothetical protein